MKNPSEKSSERQDILATDDAALSKAVMASGRTKTAPHGQCLHKDHKSQARLKVRRDLIESQTSDPKGYERLIGESNLTSINYLERGRRSADAVCRIKLPTDGGAAYGTGFLVGSRLLLTNNHVLASRAEAAQSEAEFGYEHDLDGVLSEPVQFNLRPDEIFYTNTDLDITFVAVSPLSQNGVPLERYGRLPLLPVTGKAVAGEDVSIIQHPGGEAKQIAIRASHILNLDQKKVPGTNFDHFIHYSTDTEPGSSGAPVFNDQWQVVAIHHKAVPAPAKSGSKQRWIANEGVRISAIFRHLEQLRFEDENVHLVLNRLVAALGFQPAASPVSASTSSSLKEQFAPLKLSHWASPKLGYDPAFLSKEISLDKILAPARKKKVTAPLLDKSGDELKYQHFSVIMHRERKFALMTAVNIHGAKLIHPGERKDTWRPDARIDRQYQPDDEFYVKSTAKEKVYFSRGHLVRLLDPCWGSSLADSQRGQEDTFHFTNAAPQTQTYNDQDWGNLEDYLLDKAQDTEKKLTVFTGPVFLPDDPFYGRKRKGGPWQIPLTYWKIAVLQKTKKTISAAAFIVGQTEYVTALYESKVFSGLRPYSIDEMRSRHIQTTIAAVQETIAPGSGLDFSMLKPFDAHGSLESTRQTRWLVSPADIHI